MSEATFRIIENYEPEVDYEEFKKDFLNPHMRKAEIRDKYGLSNNKYSEYRSKVLAETGLLRKPFVYNGGKVNTSRDGSEYIRKNYGFYTVIKTTRYSRKNYGSYDDYETAVMVRDKLIKHNWDTALASDLKRKYGRKRRKPALVKAEKIYDEFKKYYFDTSMPMPDVRKKLNITQRMYGYLLEMIQEEYGVYQRCKLT